MSGKNKTRSEWMKRKKKGEKKGGEMLIYIQSVTVDFGDAFFTLMYFFFNFLSF